MGKEKVNFTINSDLDKWMDKYWPDHCQSKSHLISNAVYFMKSAIEGDMEHPLLKDLTQEIIAKNAANPNRYSDSSVEKMHCPYGDFDVLLMTKTIPPLVQCDYVDNIGKCGHPGNNGKKCTYKKGFK